MCLINQTRVRETGLESEDSSKWFDEEQRSQSHFLPARIRVLNMPRSRLLLFIFPGDTQM